MPAGPLRAAVTAALAAVLATPSASACLGADAPPRDVYVVRVEVTTPMSRETRRLTVAGDAAYRLDRITTDGKLSRSCRRPVGSIDRADALLRAETAAAREVWRPHYGLGNAPTDERLRITLRDTSSHAERTTTIDDPKSVPQSAMPAGLRKLIDVVGAYARGC